MSTEHRAPTSLLAGGGTAGHVNPLLAVADGLRARADEASVLVLGTREGLESRLVPERGYELLIVDKVPFPRRPNGAALRFPVAWQRAIAQVRAHIRAHGVDVVVGFGGYASAPAYVAARREGVPVVVHEANARPGLANVLGARGVLPEDFDEDEDWEELMEEISEAMGRAGLDLDPAQKNPPEGGEGKGEGKGEGGEGGEGGENPGGES